MNSVTRLSILAEASAISASMMRLMAIRDCLIKPETLQQRLALAGICADIERLCDRLMDIVPEMRK